MLLEPLTSSADSSSGCCKGFKNRKEPKGSSVAVGPVHLGHARSIRNCQCTIKSTEIAHSISPSSWPKQESPGHISCLLRSTSWAKRSQLSSSVHFGKNLTGVKLISQSTQQNKSRNAKLNDNLQLYRKQLCQGNTSTSMDS